MTEKDLDADWLVEWALEQLDEEYGNPQGESEQDRDALRHTAMEFCAEFTMIYQPWACEIIHQETVNIAAWRKENDCDES